MYIVDMQKRAEELYPNNPTLQERWMSAIGFLRRSAVSRWVLDGQFKPNWIATAQ